MLSVRNEEGDLNEELNLDVDIGVVVVQQPENKYHINLNGK